MLKLSVSASKNYDITISENLSALENALKVLKGDKVAVITDDKVNALYKTALGEFLTDKKVFKFVVRAGEDSKNAENYLEILNYLAENGFLRSDGIIALGGGVVGDLAAFAASTYMRGIKLFMIPTSLLSMVDSSVGGKTAINLKTGKNLCGTFYQPDGVYVSLEFLKTLPAREVSSGYGEIIKYAFLGDVTKEDIVKPVSENLIYKCLKIKRDIVESDEKESGARKLLNLGHTVGHAIERLSGFTLSHGDCVIKGLYSALKLSKKINGLTADKYNEAYDIISCKNHDLSCPFTENDIINLIKVDKKSGADSVDFVLINNDLKGEIKKIGFESLHGNIL